MIATDVDDTIVAIATAPGASLRGIVRVSGPETSDCLGRFFRTTTGVPLDQMKRPTRLNGKLEVDSATSIPVSLLWWPTRRSYTRQPSAELHVPGSGPLLDLVLETCCKNGARLAQPGEFTLRAFLSGRIDLTQAEAVLAVIDSRDQLQLEAALRQLAGGLEGPISNVRDNLLGLLAELEAGLDFVEDDIQFISQADIARQLESAQQQIESTIARISQRTIHDNLVRVTLIGKPNAGKSSLFNALTRGVAIVSDVEGTTRDYITANLNVEGTSVQLIDTAGIQDEPTGRDVRIGDIADIHTRGQIDLADVRVLCVGPDKPLSDWEIKLLAEQPVDLIIVQTKSDLPSSRLDLFDQAICTSIIDESGLSELRAAICKLAAVVQNNEAAGASPAIARASESLSDARNSIQRAVDASSNQWGDEVIAAEVRAALDDLGRVVGTIYTDDILDVVFSRFCIGK